MKYKVTLKDGIELLITADKEIDAVRKAKDIKDKLSVSDARDAYAVFLGGGTPYVCFANSEASARKFAEKSEGDGSRATKVIKLVKNTRDYDYYVGDPRSVPIADAESSMLDAVPNDLEREYLKDAWKGGYGGKYGGSPLMTRSQFNEFERDISTVNSIFDKYGINKKVRKSYGSYNIGTETLIHEPEIVK